jgi:hypothetical protein
MVYPPLEPRESVYVEYEGDGKYKFGYYLQGPGGKVAPLFSVSMSLSLGGLGMIKEEVQFAGVPMVSREAALKIARVFIVPENMGTPPGALAILGGYNFKTPPGWDTVYSPILNMIERPMAPMLVVRVETDWFAHDTEFRYVLQPGEGITLAHGVPVGQVFFVPREEVTFVDATEEEVTAFHQSQSEFMKHKAEVSQKTAYGLTFSPYYLRQSRAQNDEKSPGGAEIAGRAGSSPDVPVT